MYVGATGLGIISTDYDYPGEPDLASFNDERASETIKVQTDSSSILCQISHKGSQKQGSHV